jgi:hypothetical protein
MSDFVLVKFKGDCADNFDVHGVWVTTKSSWETEKENIKRLFDDGPEDEHSCYFGSGNECVSWLTFEDWLSDHRVVELTEDEYNTLKKTVGQQFGHVLAPSS